MIVALLLVRWAGATRGVQGPPGGCSTVVIIRADSNEHAVCHHFIYTLWACLYSRSSSGSTSVWLSNCIRHARADFHALSRGNEATS